MDNNELKSHIEEILEVLSEDQEKNINKDELKKEFEKFLEYGVPVHQAKQTLIKKYGEGVTFFTSSSQRTLISDLQPNQSSVNLICRVITINPKEITVRGENRQIYFGIIGDESGTIPFTAWNEIDIEKDDVIEVTNAYTKEWQGNIQLNFGNRVNVQKTDKDKLPKDAFKPKELKIDELKSGIGSVEVTALITELEKKETNFNGKNKKIISGIMADETGKAQFTSWHDFKFKKGDVVKITGGYVKSWKGIPQLAFDENAKVKIQDKHTISKDSIISIYMPIFRIVEKRGVLDIITEGTIIEVRQGSGFIMRCPECNRVLINGECLTHGSVDGKPDLRLKILIDDGSGSVGAIIGKNITEKILGKTIEEIKNLGDETLIELNKHLFCKLIRLRGNALGDEFGPTIIVREADLIEFDFNKEYDQLFRELEDLQ